MALKGMAPITFKLTKAQGRQKRLETLELLSKHVHYLPVGGNFVSLSAMCQDTWDILFLVLVTQLLNNHNPTSLLTALLRNNPCKLHGA